MSLDELGPLFRDVVRQVYVEVHAGSGDDISFLLQEDWSVFSEAIAEVPDNRMQELCIAVLEAGLHPKHDVDEPNYRGEFQSQELWLEESWHNKLEAMLTGRSNEGPEGSYEAVQLAYEDLMDEYDQGTVLSRARIHEDMSRKDRFCLSQLGAPPWPKARAGRANRKGEPVLYLASDKATALAEVRAWKGDVLRFL